MLRSRLGPGSSFEQDAMFWREGQRHRGAFLEHFGRRTAHGQRAARPIDYVLDEVAVEQTLQDRPRGAIVPVTDAPWTIALSHLDIGRAHRDMGLAAARRLRRP